MPYFFIKSLEQKVLIVKCSQACTALLGSGFSPSPARPRIEHREVIDFLSKRTLPPVVGGQPARRLLCSPVQYSASKQLLKCKVSDRTLRDQKGKVFQTGVMPAFYWEFMWEIVFSKQS